MIPNRRAACGPCWWTAGYLVSPLKRVSGDGVPGKGPEVGPCAVALGAVSTVESSNGPAFVFFFSLQGARGLPGTAGLPGMKGHRVSLLCII